MAFAGRSRGLRRVWQKNWPDAAGLLLRRYPRFVFDPSASSLEGEIPVFTFHAVGRERLARQLRHLAVNGYRTLSAGELRAALSGREPPPRSVVLTFDDGHRSLFEVAFPLLREHGFTGVAFLVPGWIPSGPDGSPAGGEEDLAAAFAGYPLCSWDEILQMHRSGVVDFQSHTLYHNHVAVSPRVADFTRPGLEVHVFAALPVPTFARDGGGERLARLGEPVYVSAPRMTAPARWFDDVAARDRCAAIVREEGGERFFARSGWRDVLLRELRSRSRRSVFETPVERSAALRRDLAWSRELIERRLDGKTVRDLCFPWHAGDAAALQAARETGYAASYWGVLPGRRSNGPGMDPQHVVRVDNDYILLLPGEGRLTLADVLRARIANRRLLRKRPNGTPREARLHA